VERTSFLGRLPRQPPSLRQSTAKKEEGRIQKAKAAVIFTVQSSRDGRVVNMNSMRKSSFRRTIIAPVSDRRPAEQVSPLAHFTRCGKSKPEQSCPQFIRNRHQPPARRKRATLGTFAGDSVPGFRPATRAVP
jgi:hypothetical protein